MGSAAGYCKTWVSYSQFFYLCETGDINEAMFYRNLFWFCFLILFQLFLHKKNRLCKCATRWNDLIKNYPFVWGEMVSTVNLNSKNIKTILGPFECIDREHYEEVRTAYAFIVTVEFQKLHLFNWSRDCLNTLSTNSLRLYNVLVKFY